MNKLFLSCAILLQSLTASTQTAQEIKNLTAFAEAYGYVKYFHPSDQANQLDWNAFAVYGADQIIKAQNDEALVSSLVELYKPIAPASSFCLEQNCTNYAQENLNPNHQKVSEVTYWQHNGVSFGMEENAYSPYKSRRINLDREIDETAKFGNIMYSIDAAPYQGLKFRYSGAVKMADSSQGSGHLWFRVDKENGGLGFFENMGKRPIKSSEWEKYTIEGTIDQDAKALNFGVFLLGKGELFLDEAELEVYQNDGWQRVELPDPGFEKGQIKSKLKDGFWLGKGLGYAFSPTKETVYKGKSAIKITYEGMTYTEKGKPLFEGNVKAGEIINENIAEGIVAQIPLALYISENKTIPRVGADYDFNKMKLTQYMSKTTDDLAVRLGNVIILYALVKHFYPYLEASEVDLKRLLTQALEKSFSDRTDAEHVETLQAFAAPLDDGHIRIYGKSYQRHAPDIRWAWIEDHLVITQLLDSALSISIGDVVDQVNDMPAADYYQKYVSLASASTEKYKHVQASFNSLLGEENSVIQVEVDGKKHKLKRTHNYWNQKQLEKAKQIHYKSFESGISYVNLDVISIDSIQSLLPKLERSEAIIFDLRNYPNGNHGVINLLLNQKDTNKSWMRIPQYIYPNQEKIAGFEPHAWELSPDKPYLGDKKVIFITSPAAISYAESFMGFIEGYDLATIVGQPTAGTNGNVNSFYLNDGVKFNFTGMLVYKFDGKLLHGRGIEPDVYVEKTIAGTKAGKDEFLEKALEIARTKN